MYNRNRIKKIAMILAWLLVIAMVLTTFSVSIFAAESTNKSTTGSKSISKQLKEMEKVLESIEDSYVDYVDMDVLIEGAYKGIFSELDPYSQYYPVSENNDYIYSRLTGTFYGIGVAFINTDNGIEIKTITAGSGAEAAGLKSGDIIYSIDGVSYENKTATQAAVAIRSRTDEPVNIEVLRDGNLMKFTVKRQLIEQQTVSGEILDSTIGYIEISNFYSTTPSEFKETYTELKNQHPEMNNLIIDIRNNTGGLVSSAISLSDFFLDKNAVIMNYVRYGQKVYTYKADGNKIVDVPVTLLVNNNTASAAEIFAGALKDNGKASIVGATTYGKGMAQVVADLEDGAMMKLSKYYFTTPKDTVIEGNGIRPDCLIYNGDNKEAISRYENIKTVAEMDEGKKYFAGQKGLNVYAAQQRLRILGFEDISFTGTMDEATLEALKKIQSASGLYPYGALDFSTIAALEKTYQQNVFGISEDIQLNKALSLIKNQ